MLKKAVLLVGSALCFQAHAGYIQYNIHSSGMSGYFVQNEDDYSIAYFELSVASPNGGDRYIAPYHSYTDITKAVRLSTQSLPTFNILEKTEDGISQHLDFTFSPTQYSNLYTFTSNYKFENNWSPSEWATLPTEIANPSGTITRHSVDPSLVASLDYYLSISNGERYDSYLRRVVPQVILPKVVDGEVSEPTSIALLTLGMLSFSVIRRRK